MIGAESLSLERICGVMLIARELFGGICFRNYFAQERREICNVFTSAEAKVMIVTWGLSYSLKVPDLNVERVVFYDMPVISQYDCYMRLRYECANVVATYTYVVMWRDRRVALAIAQHIRDVSIEHFVCKCRTVFHCDM